MNITRSSECCICQESCNENQIHCPYCQNSFHHTCISQWLCIDKIQWDDFSYNWKIGTCPLCRKKIARKVFAKPKNLFYNFLGNLQFVDNKNTIVCILEEND